MSALEILLILRSDGFLLPVYRGGLNQADGWPWTIKKLYTGALIIDLSGVYRAADVNIVGPAGKSAFSKTLSILNSNWSIFIRLDVVQQMGFKEIAEAIKKGVAANAAANRALFDLPADEILMSLDKAKTIVELFDALGVNAPQFDALDSL